MTHKTQTPFSSDEFRKALSSFATGITIVTALNTLKKPIGMTVNSFNSVSLNPPLILWSVDKTSPSSQDFKNTPHFGVHILHTQQQQLAQQFATPQYNKFHHTPYSLSTYNIPKIHNCLACFQCETWAVYEGGDHWIIVGKVLELDTQPPSQKKALVFLNGSYTSASNPPTKNHQNPSLNPIKHAPNHQ